MTCLILLLDRKAYPPLCCLSQFQLNQCPYSSIALTYSVTDFVQNVLLDESYSISDAVFSKSDNTVACAEEYTEEEGSTAWRSVVL